MNFDLLNPEKYDEQLASKKEHFKKMLSPFTSIEPEIFESKKTHYRMRAEFRVWHEGEDLYFYMFDNEKKQKVRTDQFLAASEIINDVMKELREKIKGNPILRKKLFQVDFLSTLSSQILVTLIYHQKLDEQWKTEAEKLKRELAAKFNLHIVGRAHKQRILLDRDYVIEELMVDRKLFFYKQVENSFTQPNASVAIQMLSWANAVLNCPEKSPGDFSPLKSPGDLRGDLRGDLLELYCGNGNFSIALAHNFNKVLATELAKSSVEAAQFNIAKNKIDNLQIIRMSSEEFCDALFGGREYRRLEGIDLKTYQFTTVLVDPPRAGLDQSTLELIKKYPQILYISCNVETLCSNLAFLAQTHRVERLALFDQFPYTHHMECGVLLQKK